VSSKVQQIATCAGARDRGIALACDESDRRNAVIAHWQSGMENWRMGMDRAR